MATISGVNCTIEPSVSGKLVYLRVAPRVAGGPTRGMVNFTLRLTYSKPPGGPQQLEFEKLSVVFPGHPQDPSWVTDRRGTLADGGALHVSLGLAGPESILLPMPAPQAITVAPFFKGYDPPNFTWGLVPHQAPTPEGSWGFPFKAKDFERDEYVSVPPSHARGEQLFGHDLGAIRWNPLTEEFDHATDAKVVPDQDFDTNDEFARNDAHVFWDRPVYAVADGMVLEAVDHWKDNEAAGRREQIRRSHVDRGAVGLVSVAGIGGTPRVVTLVTDANGRLLLLSFAAERDASALTFEGKSEPGLPFGGEEISLLCLSKQLAVSIRATAGAAALSTWAISGDGKTVGWKQSALLTDTQAAKIDRLSADRVVMARQPVGA
ncbi:MAG TPA: hypothetical protein VKU40_11535, partial [Thermoanaerobaculia bacterium]|nr:hypothetical protein [Thermoanaerobaculia bacterium]